jgi:hypothetical protein
MSDKQSQNMEQTNTRHPDLEIYIKNCTAEQILQWLADQCKNVEILSSTQHSHELELLFSDQYVKSSIQQKVSGKAWTSLWFKSNETPWNTDLECAVQASQQMNTQIRCIKAGWSDSNDDNDDQWWKVENGEQELISWKG